MAPTTRKLLAGRAVSIPRVAAQAERGVPRAVTIDIRAESTPELRRAFTVGRVAVGAIADARKLVVVPIVAISAQSIHQTGPHEAATAGDVTCRWATAELRRAANLSNRIGDVSNVARDCKSLERTPSDRRAGGIVTFPWASGDQGAIRSTPLWVTPHARAHAVKIDVPWWMEAALGSERHLCDFQ